MPPLYWISGLLAAALLAYLLAALFYPKDFS
ncbi:MAG: K(+)-transporting ATPase subunit F [Candidatus Protistobacter heckmanni]|nr:K(+)-transporting ATPase subunit F [Candidatus Protistobacter heckmanni]